MSIYTYDRINLVDLSARIAGFANTLKNNDNNPNDKNKYNKDEKKQLSANAPPTMGYFLSCSANCVLLMVVLVS